MPEKRVETQSWGYINLELQNLTDLIQVATKEAEARTYKRKMSCSLILTKDRRILLQLRSEERSSFPGYITTFGGGIEDGEEPLQALIRELHEELGAMVDPADVISFGAITEAITNHTEILYLYFWHDHLGTITGCYEDQPLLFNNIESIMANPKVMDYVRWLLTECNALNLINNLHTD